jgi:hypothetical protein
MLAAGVNEMLAVEFEETLTAGFASGNFKNVLVKGRKNTQIQILFSHITVRSKRGKRITRATLLTHK